MRALLVLCALSVGCASITPMQTASVVDVGTVRVGGQIGGSAFCGRYDEGVLGVLSCTEYPDGIPIPEVRANGRYGFAKRFDVGASLQAYVQARAPERPLQVGLTLDVKGEVLRIPTSGPTHILSIGVLGAGAIAGRFAVPLWASVEWGVPLFYGVQFDKVELVAGAALTQRFLASPNVSPSTNNAHLSFSLGVYKRGPSGLGVQLSYLGDPTKYNQGAIQLGVGLFFDLQRPPSVF